MSYLVDSDVLIDALNGQQSIVAMLNRLSTEPLAISVISLGEIFDGALGTADPERHLADARSFLAPYPVITLNETIMLRFAQLRATLRSSGKLIPDFDLLIAATASVHALTLITRNRRHFERIPEINVLADL